MTPWKRLAGIAALLPTPLFAASGTVDYSDLWFNPNESGWGANIIQQDDTLFVTLFIYAANGQPTWYVASSVGLAGSGGPTSTFSGTLYRTSGPYFGAGSFSPSSVSVTPVGTLTFTATQASAATLSYNVEGVTVTKSVFRQTWDRENIAGSYLGASSGSWSSCGGGRDGYQESTAGYQVTQDQGNIQIREEGAGYTCSYTGSYTQSGRLGAIAGGGTCSDGVNQTFTASELQVSPLGIQMRVAFNQPGGCRFNGRISAVRRGQ